MIDACPICSAQFSQRTWLDRGVKYLVQPPWSPQYEMWFGRCFNCHRTIRSVHVSFNGGRPITWDRSNERLLWGGDYKTIYTRRRGRSRVGILPLNLIWMWVPATTKNLVYVLGEKVQEIVKQAGHANVIVLPPGFVWTDLLGIEEFVDEIIELAPHVMQGAQGPYPSLRAELSLNATFGPQQLERMYHFWPAASLPESDYLPLGTDEYIAKEWAVYARSNIPLEFPQ